MFKKHTNVLDQIMNEGIRQEVKYNSFHRKNVKTSHLHKMKMVKTLGLEPNYNLLSAAALKYNSWDK